jgi:hypothetical protein
MLKIILYIIKSDIPTEKNIKPVNTSVKKSDRKCSSELITKKALLLGLMNNAFVTDKNHQFKLIKASRLINNLVFLQDIYTFFIEGQLFKINGLTTMAVPL